MGAAKELNQLETPDSTPVRAMLIGVPSSMLGRSEKQLSTIEATSVPYDMDKVLEPLGTAPDFIFCGPPPVEVSLLEVAQSLRMLYQDTPIFFLSPIAKGADKKSLKKNGFTDIFLIPLDHEYMFSEVERLIARVRDSKSVLRSVRFIDILPNTKLDFDTFVYLPVNNKHVRLTSSGDEVSEAKATKLKQSGINEIFIPESQMRSFYRYTAERLKALEGDQALSETEKRERLSNAVRDLITGFFSSTAASTVSGKEVVDDCNQIIKTYITSTPSGKWFDRIQTLVSEAKDTYSNATLISTLSAMFSIATGIGKPEELAMAGLLADIGITRVPESITAKSPQYWSTEERAQYEMHPDHSITIIKERKLVVSENIFKLISQHHEKFNGMGFPRKLSKGRIAKDAMVLAFAVEFNELTKVQPGKKAMLPVEAFNYIHLRAMGDPAQSQYDPEILKALAAVFPKFE